MHSRLLLFLLPTMRAVSIVLITTALCLVLVEADIRRECRKQTGVSWGALKKFRAANFQQDDKKLKCYVKCFMKKNGIFGERDIDIDKALRHLPKGVQGTSKRVLESCKNVPSTDPCDKAFQIVKCFSKQEPEILRGVPFV
ncbi:general odorant-binding protein 56d [Diachasma alloeum]|uniref:Odorant binding protein 9 n=1 Tax=Diachasma alloeum TaxID=454923 RepID=A0A4E0RSE8_9HYME|nr:general odorant-binding protein 56d [Diachasma alloeum]THK32847.1 odorant binding protein 9 [Diachasma alloeum]